VQTASAASSSKLRNYSEQAATKREVLEKQNLRYQIQHTATKK